MIATTQKPHDYKYLVNIVKILFSMLMKYFIYTALKPYQDIFEILENLMRMEKIMDTKSENWNVYNDKIPNWFYKMIIMMGISVFLGFLLILAGSI